MADAEGEERIAKQEEEDAGEEKQPVEVTKARSVAHRRCLE